MKEVKQKGEASEPQNLLITSSRLTNARLKLFTSQSKPFLESSFGQVRFKHLKQTLNKLEPDLFVQNGITLVLFLDFCLKRIRTLIL